MWNVTVTTDPIIKSPLKMRLQVFIIMLKCSFWWNFTKPMRPPKKKCIVFAAIIKKVPKTKHKLESILMEMYFSMNGLQVSRFKSVFIRYKFNKLNEFTHFRSSKILPVAKNSKKKELMMNNLYLITLK